MSIQTVAILYRKTPQLYIAAILYCRSLIADAENHGVKMEFDVYRHNNTVTDLDVTIPDNQRKNYGLPEKVVEEESTEPTA